MDAVWSLSQTRACIKASATTGFDLVGAFSALGLVVMAQFTILRTQASMPRLVKHGTDTYAPGDLVKIHVLEV